MKGMTDKEIQEMIDRGLIIPDTEISSADDHDLKTYQLLYEALATPPETQLSHDFSARITAKLQARKNHHAELKLYLLVAGIIVLFLSAAFIYLLAINNAPTSKLMIALLKYKWIALFGITSLCVIQLLDQKLVKSHREAAY